MPPLPPRYSTCQLSTHCAAFVSLPVWEWAPQVSLWVVGVIHPDTQGLHQRAVVVAVAVAVVTTQTAVVRIEKIGPEVNLRPVLEHISLVNE